MGTEVIFKPQHSHSYTKITIAQGFENAKPPSRRQKYLRGLCIQTKIFLFVYLPSLIMDCTAIAFSPKTTSLFKLRIIGIKKKRQTTSPATVLLLLRVITDRTNFVAVFANLGLIIIFTSDIFALIIGSSPEEKETNASKNSV